MTHNEETRLWLEQEKYRQDNNITGNCFTLKFITDNRINPITEMKDDNTDEKRIKFIKNKIRPIGLCLYTTKKYHMLCDAMTWSLQLVTDDLEYFEEETKDNWSGEKGKLRNEDCWSVLSEIQGSMSYQSWTSILQIINDSN